MWIEYDQYDFVKWTVKRMRRWIDPEEMLKHNALFQRLMDGKLKPKRRRKRRINAR